MIYALVASNLAWAALAAFLVSTFRRYVALQDARENNWREKAREREDQLLNRIQAPTVAVADSLADKEDFVLPAFDDALLAEDEAERLKLRAD